LERIKNVFDAVVNIVGPQRPLIEIEPDVDLESIFTVVLDSALALSFYDGRMEMFSPFVTRGAIRGNPDAQRKTALWHKGYLDAPSASQNS
jgi:hypothetical protein